MMFGQSVLVIFQSLLRKDSNFDRGHPRLHPSYRRNVSTARRLRLRDGRRRAATPSPHLLTAARPCPVPAIAIATTSSLKHRLIITVPAIFGDHTRTTRTLDPDYDKFNSEIILKHPLQTYLPFFTRPSYYISRKRPRFAFFFIM